MSHPVPFRCTFRVFATSIACLGMIAVPDTQAQTWNLGIGGDWTTATNWNPNDVPNEIGAAVTFNGAATALNPAQTANRDVEVDGTQIVGSILFNADLSSFSNTLSSGTAGRLTFDQAGAGPATITTMGSGTGNNTISKAMDLVDSLVANVDQTSATSGAGSLNLTGTMIGAGGFTKNGAGLATFGTGERTYTGPTILNGGRMRISFAARPQTTSNFTINTGAQLELISSSSAFNLGAGTLFLNGSGPTTGAFSGFPGAIRPATNLAITIPNPVVLQSPTLIHVQGSATGALTFSSTVSGPGSLTLGGLPHDSNLGKIVLSGANTYEGGSFVQAGDLQLSGTNASLGTGDVTVISGAVAGHPFALARLSILAGVLNGIDDTATLSLAGGSSPAVADNGYVLLESGINETVGELILGGVAQLPGTYGSMSSGADFKSDEYFAGTGILTVVPEPASAAILLTGLGALAGARRRLALR